jgi:SAM-dependent methyltransferase
MPTDDFATRYDAIISHPRTLALYGDSGYYNVGLWSDGVRDQRQACDRLVDELAGLIPADARFILDVGCGLGAGTRRLADHFPEAEIVGGNISPWQVDQAMRRGVKRAIVMDAVCIPLGDETADCVVAMESAQHFDTRERFLYEALRVLRPGGCIVLADMLFRDREPIGTWMLPAENDVDGPEAYAGLLREVGYRDVVARDVTSLTWTPYCEAMRAATPEHRDQIDGYEPALAYYVFAFGRKG